MKKIFKIKKEIKKCILMENIKLIDLKVANELIGNNLFLDYLKSKSISTDSLMPKKESDYYVCSKYGVKGYIQYKIGQFFINDDRILNKHLLNESKKTK